MIRQIFLAVLLVPVVLFSGSAGWVFLGGPLAVQAAGPATIPTDAAAANGFDEPSVEHVNVDETVAYQGFSKDVAVSIYVTQTTKVSESGGAGVVVASLPAWRVGGVVNLNPLSYLPLEQAFEYVLPHLPIPVEQMEKVDEQTVTIAGDETSVAKFRVSTGTDVGYVHLTRTTVDGDLLFVVGQYPENARQEASVLDVISAITHE